MLRERRAESLPAHGVTHPRGVAFTGTIWLGGAALPRPGVLVIDGRGRVATMIDVPGAASATGFAAALSAAGLPSELPVLGGAAHWIVPGVIDAHVHLAFDPLAAHGGNSCAGSGLVAVRDLGAPLQSTRSWRTGHRTPSPGSLSVSASGPILTAVGGYPARSWGAGGFAEFVSSPAHARAVVRHLAAEGVDLIKLALEPGEREWPVLSPGLARAVVDAAHAAGLPAVAHALRPDMVSRALDVGIDELVHTPNVRLSAELIDRIAASGIGVTSTLQTFFSAGLGREAAANAADLVEAGVRLRYGTDLGNAGTRPGVDPRELDRLADTGLGRLGALRAATEYSATAPGMRHRTGMLRLGEPACLVLLPANPLDEPGVWRTPTAVYADGRVTVVAAPGNRLWPTLGLTAV
jgi:imidazolonepropionase-like amidohydrolase